MSDEGFKMKNISNECESSSGTSQKNDFLRISEITKDNSKIEEVCRTSITSSLPEDVRNGTVAIDSETLAKFVSSFSTFINDMEEDRDSLASDIDEMTEKELAEGTEQFRRNIDSVNDIKNKQNIIKDGFNLKNNIGSSITEKDEDSRKKKLVKVSLDNSNITMNLSQITASVMKQLCRMMTFLLSKYEPDDRKSYTQQLSLIPRKLIIKTANLEKINLKFLLNKSDVAKFIRYFLLSITKSKRIGSILKNESYGFFFNMKDSVIALEKYYLAVEMDKNIQLIKDDKLVIDLNEFIKCCFMRKREIDKDFTPSSIVREAIFS